MTPLAPRLAVALLLGLTAASSAQAATATRTSSFVYDATTGLLTKETVEPNDAILKLETTYTLDAFGNRTAVAVKGNPTGLSGATDVTRTSTVTYEASGRFATTAANALSHSETRAFDARFGVATSLTGPNGLTTTWTYDNFGRKTLETRADGTKTKYEYKFCSGVAGGSETCPTINGAAGKYVTITTPLASDGTTQIGPWAKTYLDALERPIRKSTQGFSTGTPPVIHVDTEYDSLGRVKRVSRPYFDGVVQ